MIRIGIQYEERSSVQFIHARNYCSQKSLLKQLSTDIHFCHTYKQNNPHDFAISQNRLTILQEQIHNGINLFHSLEYRIIKEENLSTYTQEIQSYYVFCTRDSDNLYTLKLSDEDLLVLDALSLMLYRLSCRGSLLDENHRLGLKYHLFYNNLQNSIGKVDRLLRIDLSPSMEIIPNCLVLKQVLSYVGEGYIYQLIKAILDLPIVDEHGLRQYINSFMPTILGDFSQELFNIVLIEIFDRQFKQIFPGKSFYRCHSGVFIGTRVNDEVVFDQNVGYKLLDELGLRGTIESIEPGGPYIRKNDSHFFTCENGLLYLRDDGSVFYDYDERELESYQQLLNNMVAHLL